MTTKVSKRTSEVIFLLSSIALILTGVLIMFFDVITNDNYSLYYFDEITKEKHAFNSIELNTLKVFKATNERITNQGNSPYLTYKIIGDKIYLVNESQDEYDRLQVKGEDEQLNNNGINILTTPYQDNDNTIYLQITKRNDTVIFSQIEKIPIEIFNKQKDRVNIGETILTTDKDKYQKYDIHYCLPELTDSIKK